MDAFRHVSDAFEQTSETIGVRANNAINDVVRQRLLNRFTSEQAERERNLPSDAARHRHY